MKSTWKRKGVKVQVQAEAEEEIGETHGREQGEEKGREQTIKSHTWMTMRMRRSVHQHLSQCGITHHSARALCRRKSGHVRCTVYTPRRLQRIAISCKRNLQQQTCRTWGRRVPFLVLLKRGRFCTFFSCFSVEAVHDCDCGSEVWSKSHRCILARFVWCEIPMFLISQIFVSGKTVRVVFLCQFFHLDAFLLGPANFELQITIFWVS